MHIRKAVASGPFERLHLFVAKIAGDFFKIIPFACVLITILSSALAESHVKFPSPTSFLRVLHRQISVRALFDGSVLFSF